MKADDVCSAQTLIIHAQPLPSPHFSPAMSSFYGSRNNDWTLACSQHVVWRKREAQLEGFRGMAQVTTLTRCTLDLRLRCRKSCHRKWRCRSTLEALSYGTSLSGKTAHSTQVHEKAEPSNQVRESKPKPYPSSDRCQAKPRLPMLRS